MYIAYNIFSNTEKTLKPTTHLQCHVNAAWVVLMAITTQKMENEHLKVQRFPSDADEEQKWINTLINILFKESMQDMIVCIKF